VALELDRPIAQVALAWASSQPDITSTIIGASRLEQLRGNLTSLEIRFTPEQLRSLDQASVLDPAFPYGIFSPAVNRMIFGGSTVEGWH
jgi:aryl-alcohol dehydrogenase-like predicted oxidoreductase